MTNVHIRSLRTRTWCAALQAMSGATTAYGLERLLSPASIKVRKDGTRTSSCRWYKYKRGLICPAPRTVSRVERACPGSSVWIQAPLWALIGDDHVEKENLAVVICKVRPHLAKHFKSLDPWLSSPSTIDSLWKQGDLGAFEALVALIRHAESTANLAQYVEASWAALHVASLLSVSTPLETVRDEFLQVLWDRFFQVLQEVPSPMRADFDPQSEAIRLKETLEIAKESGTISGRWKERARLACWLAKQIYQVDSESTPVEPNDLLARYVQKGVAETVLRPCTTNYINRARLRAFTSSLSLADDRDLMDMFENEGKRISARARHLSGCGVVLEDH